jgi:hypothetical protein
MRGILNQHLNTLDKTCKEHNAKINIVKSLYQVLFSQADALILQLNLPGPYMIREPSSIVVRALACQTGRLEFEP